MDSKNIWFVDDNPAFRFLMDGILSNTKYAVRLLFFADGQRLLDTLSEGHPQVIYLDLYMNEMDGWQVLEELAKRRYEGKVILLTSSASTEDEARAAAHPMVAAYLSKPLTKDTFLSTVA